MNETVCNQGHYMPRLMWPHGSSLCRNGGKLVPAACANSGGAIVGRLGSLWHKSFQVSSHRHVAHIGSPGRVVISMESSFMWSRQHLNHGLWTTM